MSKKKVQQFTRPNGAKSFARMSGTIPKTGATVNPRAKRDWPVNPPLIDLGMMKPPLP